MTDPAILPGVIAVLTDEDGRVIAAEADFDQSSYAGFALVQSQASRVRRSVSTAMVNAYASPALTRAISPYDRERLMEELHALFRDAIERANEIPVDEDDPLRNVPPAGH